MFTKDKLYHLVAGFVIGLVFGLINPVLALFAIGFAGIGKEAYDVYVKNSFADPVDMIATLFGGILGTAISVLLINIL